MKALMRVVSILSLTIGFDLLTKRWAERTLTPFEPVLVLGDTLRWTLGYNTGVAFGVFDNGGPLVLLLTSLVIIGLVIWLGSLLRGGAFPLMAWPAVVILGGALANLIDRFPDGRVTDFVDVGIGAARWPTFNLADSWISVGMLVLFLLAFGRQPVASSVESGQAA